jgi:hypothetical protein
MAASTRAVKPDMQVVTAAPLGFSPLRPDRRRGENPSKLMAPIFHTAVIVAALALIGLGAYGLAPTLFKSRLAHLRRGTTEDEWEAFDENEFDAAPYVAPSLPPLTVHAPASFAMPRAWDPGPASALLSPSGSSASAKAVWDAPEESHVESGETSDDAEEWPEDDEADEVLDIFREVLPARAPGEERRAALLQAEQGRVSITELLADARLTARAVLGRPSGAFQR